MSTVGNGTTRLIPRTESQSNGIVWIRYDENETFHDKGQITPWVNGLQTVSRPTMQLGMIGWIEMSRVFTVSTACHFNLGQWFSI